MSKGYKVVPNATWVRIEALLEVCAREMPCVASDLQAPEGFCTKTLGHDVNSSCRRHWAQDILDTMKDF